MFTSASATHLLFLSILLFISSASTADDACRPVACNDMGPEIRFPFRLKDRQPARCGYRGFDLTCNARGETILTLPKAGEFAVSEIVYMSRIVYLYDPDFCPGKKLLNFTLAGTAFRGASEAARRYTILQCSRDWSEYTSYRAIPLFCRENMGANNTVLAMTPRTYALEKPPACRPVKKNVSIPLSWDSYYQFWGPLKQLQLTWDKPDCRNCEAEDQLCGFGGDSGSEIVCSKPPSKGVVLVYGPIPRLTRSSQLVWTDYLNQAGPYQQLPHEIYRAIHRIDTRQLRYNQDAFNNSWFTSQIKGIYIIMMISCRKGTEELDMNILAFMVRP